VAGFVFEAFDTVNNRRVAVKRTTKAGEFISREFEVLEKLRDCKNCIKLLDIYYTNDEEAENPKKIQNLVFEYCSQNLEDIIQRAKSDQIAIPMPNIKNYMH
jgi:serine/threonine protein kinase